MNNELPKMGFDYSEYPPSLKAIFLGSPLVQLGKALADKDNENREKALKRESRTEMLLAGV